MEKNYDHKKHELMLKQEWQDQGIYKVSPEAQMYSAQMYSIDTPPPTVSGSLHIGHIFSYTQTDIIARYKRMSGLSVFYPFGFDDNGLPTERFVEKKREINAHSMKRSEFIELCLQETAEVETKFKELWQDMGLSVDWDKCYSTISETSRKISQESFIRLFQKGFIYRKHEPALYCTTCRTTVAQAELDDVEKSSLFNDIVFKSEDGSELIVGTTRPEFLASCVAIFYNPNDRRYTQLQGKQAVVPLFNYTVPIIADEAVVIEKGTGLVMCCTFGDKTDIGWFKKYNLPYKTSLKFDGRFDESIDIIGGLKVTQAREAILAELSKQGFLRNQKAIVHMVNVHERCKKEIEYLALTQWFLSILPHKQKFLELADELDWFPSFMKSRYINWVEAISWDWCLSRQRFYGIPFPAWHCINGHVIVASLDQLPIDPQEQAYKGHCPECDSAVIEPDKDVMDTWNTSSLTPQICFALLYPDKNPFESAAHEFIPMSMRPQAHDIIRTWAFYTIVKSWMHYGRLPWKNIIISGHVLSDTKEKLSKSKENTKISPEFLLQTYSADVIRYWTASGRLGQDVAFSENQLKIGQRLVTKLWNAFRFIHEHMNDAPMHQTDPVGTINEWLLHQSSACFVLYKKYFEEGEFSLALDAIEKFFWHDFCDNYIELVKEQLFKPELYSSDAVAGTRWTLYTAGLHILQLFAPYLPYITETLYKELYGQKEKTISVHSTHYDSRKFIFEQSAAITQHLIILTTHIRSLKTARQLSLKVPLQNLEIHCNEKQILDALMPLEQIIKGVTHAASIIYSRETIESAELIGEQDIWNAKVPLG